MTREVNAHAVWTVAEVREPAICRLVWRRLDERIRKSCRLSMMSCSSSFFPRHESLNSPTHRSGETLEFAKSPRNRNDSSASSFWELLTWAVSVLVALFSRTKEELQDIIDNR